MSRLNYQPAYRRHLPHIQPPGAALFVTFRLAGSIPVQDLRRLNRDAAVATERLGRIRDRAERRRQGAALHGEMFVRWDACLDQPRAGPTWLGEEQVAQIVVDKLHALDGQLYDLDTHCVMSNHVHLLFRPLLVPSGQVVALSRIMHSLKRHTALQANLYLGRRGQFWQHESYDHVVRHARELARIRRYILHNPVKAGLVSAWDAWPWSYVGQVQGT